MANDNDFLFIEDEADPAEVNLAPWRIAVIDDERQVYEATCLALDGLRFEGRGFELIYAASAAEGRRLLADNPSIPVVLLDVVMETDRAGLDLARDIRESQKNQTIRIILRTGQPGYAPPMEVIERYDINDYNEKTELTRTRLFTSVSCSLRSFQQISALDQNRQGLKMIIEASSSMMGTRGAREFSQGVLTQLAAHLGIPPDGMLCVRQRTRDAQPFVVGAAGRFATALERPLFELDAPEAVAVISEAIDKREEVIRGADLALYIAGSEWMGVIYLHGKRDVTPLEREMLRLFCDNVTCGYENVRLFNALSEVATTDRATGLATAFKMAGTIDALMDSGQLPHLMVCEIAYFGSMGREFGPAFQEGLLRTVAERLAARFSGSARLHGGRFALLVGESDIPALKEALAQPFSSGGLTLRLEFDYGVVQATAGIDGAGLIAEAEWALATGTLSPATLEGRRNRLARMAHAAQLFRAMREGRIVTRFEPCIGLADGRVEGLHLRAAIEADEFAVEHGDLTRIADSAGFGLELACHLAKLAGAAARHIGLAERHLRLWLNVGASPFRSVEALAELHLALEGSGLAPAQIDLAVSEELAMSSAASRAIDAAIARGYRIALVEFGAHTMSMAALARVGVVAIGQAFLAAAMAGPADRALLSGALQACRDRSLPVVAAGVQSAAEADFARSIGLSAITGPQAGAPMEADALGSWLDGRHV